MKIIIELKDRALLSEIDEFDKVLQFQKERHSNLIKSISKE